MKKIDDVKDSLRRSRNVVYGLSILSELSERYKDIEDNCLLEYVPVKIVSCFEEHFRQLYKDIIEKPKYRANIKKVKGLKDPRFDLDFIINMQASEMTLEDYLSYNFPCSSVDQVLDQLGTLLNVKFKSLLIDKIIEIDDKVDIPEEESRANVSYFIESIGIIFQARHIICHEGTPPNKLDHTLAMQMISDAQLFLEFVDRLLYDILYPGDTLSQTAMNIEAAKSCEEAEEELESLIMYLQNNVTEPAPNFGYIETWKEYRKKKAESDSEGYQGGTVYPTIYGMSMESTTRQMISQLKKEYRLFNWEWQDVRAKDKTDKRSNI